MEGEGLRCVSAGRCALLLATFFIIVLLQPFYFGESAPLILLMPAFLLSSVCECRYAWRHARAHRARVYFGKLSLGFFFSTPFVFCFFVLFKLHLIVATASLSSCFFPRQKDWCKPSFYSFAQLPSLLSPMQIKINIIFPAPHLTCIHQHRLQRECKQLMRRGEFIFPITHFIATRSAALYINILNIYSVHVYLLRSDSSPRSMCSNSSLAPCGGVTVRGHFEIAPISWWSVSGDLRHDGELPWRHATSTLITKTIQW